MDREKIIDRIYDAIDYGVCVDLFMDILELLKEQEKQKFFVDESGKITPLPVIVRCKDCKYNDDGECVIKAGWFPVDEDWYCADGEKSD